MDTILLELFSGVGGGIIRGTAGQESSLICSFPVVIGSGLAVEDIFVYVVIGVVCQE
jgi:hypothetical protein